MRTFALILAATLLTTAGAQETPKGELDASARKVKELRQERIATLKQAAEVSLHLAQRGLCDIREVSDARMTLLKAELDAAEKEPDRIALYKDAINSLKEFEALAKAAKEAARASELDRLTVVAKRLEVEIWLEQAQSKAAK